MHIVVISLGIKANGKRRRTQRTFKTLAEAKRGRVQMLKAQQEGRLTEVRNDTVYTYGLWWTREVKPQHIRETTAADYEDRLRRYVFPLLGHVRMVDLKTEHIISWMNELKRSGKSTNTINVPGGFLLGCANTQLARVSFHLTRFWPLTQCDVKLARSRKYTNLGTRKR